MDLHIHQALLLPLLVRQLVENDFFFVLLKSVFQSFDSVVWSCHLEGVQTTVDIIMLLFSPTFLILCRLHVSLTLSHSSPTFYPEATVHLDRDSVLYAWEEQVFGVNPSLLL